MAETNAELIQGPMPTLWTDRAALVEVLRQLINNAIRYRLPDQPPRIEVSVRREKEYWLFVIADNGPGVAAEYREQVFALFKRLHRHDDIAGAGMGLPLCRRLVEQRGGQIWAERASGGGAAFCFTLPIIEGESGEVETNTHFAG
jgi:light-regulated signal transduction histidine kinase (bacteriophytochrome)